MSLEPNRRNLLGIVSKLSLALIPLLVVESYFQKHLKEILNLFRAGAKLEYGGFELIPLFLGSYFLPLLFFFLGVQVLLILKTSASPQKVFELKKLGELVLEDLRVWGKVIAWGFLFVIPGFLKFLSLIFVPWIVLGVDQYEKNKIDALKLSEHLTRGDWTRTVLVFLALFVAPTFPDSVLGYAWNSNLPYVWDHVASPILRSVLYAFAFLYVHSVFKEKMLITEGQFPEFFSNEDVL